MTTNWQDTVKARTHGVVEGFHSHNADLDEIRDVEAAAARAGRPESAHASGATLPVAAGGPTADQVEAAVAVDPAAADHDLTHDDGDNDPASRSYPAEQPPTAWPSV